jgi:RNA polymerase sigma factor (sigma-70 family)
MSSKVMSDAEIWEKLTEDNENAFSLLFKRYYPVMMNYGRSITRHHYMVSDCIQEVFTDLWMYRNSVVMPESVKAYLLSSLRKRIARKLERDRVFSNSTGIEDIEFSVTFTILDQTIQDEELTQQTRYLNSLLNQLPPRQQEALYLRYYQQLSIEEIASTMQINYQSAANLIHRSISQLRNLSKVEASYLLSVLLLITNFPQ